MGQPQCKSKYYLTFNYNIFNFQLYLWNFYRFEGEDLSYKGRIINQEIQKKAWLDAQIAEKKQNEKEYEEVMGNYIFYIQKFKFFSN